VTRVYLGLGSNLGDRAANIRRAIDHLNDLADTSVVRHSSFYETEPVGAREQPDFLNAAAEVATTREPLDLLHAIKSIERSMGRDPDADRWGPRLIDIDILLWGDAVIETLELRIPHPEFRKRRFVLEPLCELAPDLIDPESGRSIGELLAESGDSGWVRIVTGADAPD
jgi:2-amino-4-hydroxy-6-hydroxymethyldihydropteridine diphosphokinase